MRTSLVYFLATLCLGLAISAAWMSQLAREAVLQVSENEKAIKSLRTDIFAARLQTAQERKNKQQAELALQKASQQFGQMRSSYRATQAALKRSRSLLFATKQAKSATEQKLRDTARQLADGSKIVTGTIANTVAQDGASLIVTSVRDTVSSSSTAHAQNSNAQLVRQSQNMATSLVPVSPQGVAKAVPKKLPPLVVKPVNSGSGRLSPAAQTGFVTIAATKPVVKPLAEGSLAATAAPAKIAITSPPAIASTIPPKSPKVANGSNATQRMRTIASRLNVRAKPSIRAPLVRTLTPGQKIYLVGVTSNGKWHKVTDRERLSGYIKTTALLANSK